jgi:hypothetical protein
MVADGEKSNIAISRTDFTTPLCDLPDDGILSIDSLEVNVKGV